MALNRRSILTGFLVGLLFGCASHQVEHASVVHPLTVKDPPRRPGTDLVMMVMPIGTETQELRKALLEEVSEDLDLVTVNSANLTVDGLARQLAQHAPQALVLVDNRNVKLYRRYQRNAPAGTLFPPALVLMTSFAAESISGLQNVSAIGYEPAALTGMVAMRKVLDKPLKRMGVLYRRPLVDFVNKQEHLAWVESIEFERIELGAAPTREEVEWAVDLLVEERDIDVLWVLNDNVLLSREYLKEVWLPTLRHNHVPVLVGVEALVSPQLDFGSLAVIPNLELLGVQAANVLLDMADEDWQASSEVLQPLSVKTVMNGPQVRKFFGLTVEGTRQIDRVLE